MTELLLKSLAFSAVAVLVSVALQPGNAGAATDSGTPEPGAKALAELAMDACFRNGEDESGLKSIAGIQAWRPVSNQELAKQSNTTARMLGGWIHQVAAVPVAIMQSRQEEAPPVYVCSITAKLSAGLTFSTLKTAFETLAATTPATSTSREGQAIEAYWLHHSATCDSRISLVHSVASSTVTVRVLHGRLRNGTQHDDAYSEAP